MRPGQSRLALASLAICLLLAEALVRTVLPIPEERLLPFAYNRDRVRQIDRGDTYLTYDADLGWTLTPNRTRREGGNTYRINRQGLRADREYPLKPPPNVRRISAFGDSFTHCSDVTQDDCWTTQLERAWPATEVLNFGVPGFGPDQAWLRYQRDGQAFNGCAVLIGHMVSDIDRVVNRFRPFLYPDDSVVLSKPRFLLDGDGLTLLPNPVTDPLQLLDPRWAEETLGPHDSWYVPGIFVESALDRSWLVRLARTANYRLHRRALERGPRAYPLYSDEQEAFQLTRRILAEHVREVREVGASPVVLIFPGEEDLEMLSEGLKPYELLIEKLRDDGIDTIDLTPALADEAGRTGLDGLFDERHYSQRGNGVVANELARILPSLVDGTCQRSAALSGG